MASRVQDDGFHEIQLNGKQLVFVFMAATVVSVVIFLCGVLVGRGVRAERGTTTELVDATPSTLGTSGDMKPDLAVPERPPTVVETRDDPTKASPPAPPSADGESAPAPEAPRKPAATAAPAPKPAAPVEATKPAVTPPPPATAAAKPTDPATAPGRPDTATAESSAKAPVVAALPLADESRQGWVIQVAATKTRGEADTMAKRLSAKGYSAFVLSNTANVFRVRVGGYKSRGDAETVAAKLRKEERINPWVTR